MRQTIKYFIYWKNQLSSTSTDEDNQEEQPLYIDENVKSSDSIPFTEEIVIEYTEISLSNFSNNPSDVEENDNQFMSISEIDDRGHFLNNFITVKDKGLRC